MLALLRTFSWQELRHHPWRAAAAAVSVMLGVALAFAVHVIHASALSEFTQAVRAASGQPDLQLRAVQGDLPEALYGRVALHPQVARAGPVLEIAAQALPEGAAAPPVALRVVGADTLRLAAMAPELVPRAFPDADRLALFSPATVFLNAAAMQALGLPDGRSGAVRLQSGLAVRSAVVAGTVAAAGAPLAVMDIGAAQDFFGRIGRLGRIDVQLRPGHSAEDFRAALPDLLQGLGLGATDAARIAVVRPQDTAQRTGDLSRAYRVNLTVLALVALFTGAYLVFSVLALSVAQRAPQFALLAVLGATPRARRALVLAESAALGVAGSAAGIALGTLLAALALRWMGGDLGGGYFDGVRPSLQWSPGAALLYGALGTAAALAGGWWPARDAERLPPAQTLKGLGGAQGPQPRLRLPALAVAAGVALAFAPPVAGIPLGAYASVGLLLVGGIGLLPVLVHGLLGALVPAAARRPLALLALERARRMRGMAAVAVGGVVASLGLAVALTVMVASFRGSVMQWLDAALPAPLYVRAAGAAAGDDGAAFPPGWDAAVARLPGVERAEALRVSALLLDPARPPVALLARPLDRGPAQSLPLREGPLPVPAGRIGVYVSEAVVDLYGVRPGADWPALSASFGTHAAGSIESSATFFIAGVWRDYVRQFGAVAMDRADFIRLTGDARINDLAVWPAPGADEAALRAAIAAAVPALAQGTQAEPTAGPALEFSTSAAIRERSLALFDRSFAVTYWLQAVAIGIGLFGVAASFSAQVLARRKEFGLLAHLGLTRAQVLAVVAGEGAAWTAVGAVAGTGLGLAVSAVLVHVVNPQSFHWSMDLRVPALRLGLLGVAVVVTGTLAAWLSGHSAAKRGAVLAVKDDW
ncbi:ABC transporter permease [Acidovorax sp. NCPPB 4044]|uniref:ABC transporter permease n=1 Tax=Acidovorax sp. NCPPB 4044 TaxID=2940490 RepID=UPI002304570F|nr:ABC transporter permease [Acidovorax sp. NCPPB 4044]MDA8519808.1 ABC transporter permease [Acidovorax sp. NCPPB 4044]